MEDISIVGLLLVFVLFTFFLVELCRFILSFDKGKRIGIPIHLIGIIGSIFLLIFTVSATFGYNISSKPFTYVTIILGVLSFIAISIDSFIVEKSERRSRCRSHSASRSRKGRKYRSLIEN